MSKNKTIIDNKTINVDKVSSVAGETARKKQLLLELLELEDENLGKTEISNDKTDEKPQDDIPSQKDEETDKITAPKNLLLKSSSLNSGYAGSPAKKLEENRESPKGLACGVATERRKRGPKKGQITQLTEKQKEALKKGQQIRDENNRKRLEEKRLKEEEEKKIQEEKIIKKAISLKKKQIKKQKILEELSDDDDEQVIKEKIIAGHPHTRKPKEKTLQEIPSKETIPKYIFTFI